MDFLLIVSSITLIGAGVYTIIIDKFVFKGGHAVRGGEAIFVGIVFIVLGIIVLYQAVLGKRDDKYSGSLLIPIQCLFIKPLIKDSTLKSVPIKSGNAIIKSGR